MLAKQKEKASKKKGYHIIIPYITKLVPLKWVQQGCKNHTTAIFDM